MHRVLITGITGMDGSLLADQLLSQGCHVFGLVRRSASGNTSRIQKAQENPNLTLIDGDVTSQESIFRAIEKAEPQIVFHLAAQSFVPYSWDAPVSTFEISAIGTLNVLEAIRNIDRSIKFYQASSSEMFGKVLQTPQTETTPFYPRSPYGIAKACAHYTTINYRESFGIHACSGILFNHEHERRGEHFVSKKITQGVANILSKKLQGLPFEPLPLGNLEARRDWGYAEDYVQAMIAIMQHPIPDTFVIATGVTRTVRQMCEATVNAASTFLSLPTLQIQWVGKNENEIGLVDGEPFFGVSKEFYRPAEVDLLLGDPTKAKKYLHWEPQTSFEKMMEKMFIFDYEKISKKIGATL